jgi:Fe2+ transport system protein FeoA
VDSNSDEKHEHMNSKEDSSLGSAFPLTFASEGQKVRIVALKGGRGFQERLISMGFNEGDEIEIVQSRQHGSVLVASEGGRYVLGGGMAQKIMVIQI